MRAIDEEYYKAPFYGSRRMVVRLNKMGFEVGRKKVIGLMRKMGLQVLYPKLKREPGARQCGRFPYLLKNFEITSPNQVWGTDITYIPLQKGYLFLTAVIDLYSRFGLSWEISNSLDSGFCIRALERAFEYGIPAIINSDQGVQFTSEAYINLVQSKGVQVSMAGKGRCYDNILTERFWRSIKHEEVYLQDYDSAEEAIESIGAYMQLYNYERPHMALNYETPWDTFKLGASPQTPRQTISGQTPFLGLAS